MRGTIRRQVLIELGRRQACQTTNASSPYRSNEARVSINPRKIYNLAELIDIAERNNPETRVAWERARQAAAAVGLSESAYYPFLAASAAAGYDRAFIPFPDIGGNPTHPRYYTMSESPAAVRLSQRPRFTAEN